MITIEGTPPPDDAGDDWNPDRYVAAVRRNLQIVFASRVGAALRVHLWRHLVIRPWHSLRQENASTHPVDWEAARPAGDPFRFDQDSAVTPEDDTGRPIEWLPSGTGGGSNVEIRYTPGIYLDPSAPIPRGDRAPSYADVTLLHELVHAVRMMWGLISHQRVDPESAANVGLPQ